MSPGEIHWGQDIGTRAIGGNHGHRSGQLGELPCVHLMIQFKVPSGSTALACPFDDPKSDKSESTT